LVSVAIAASTVAGGVGAVAAVVIAVRALRVNRQGAVAGPLLQAFEELFASVGALSDTAVLLAKDGESGERSSRDALRHDFHRLEVATTKIDLLAHAMSPKDLDYGSWLRDATRNLAVNLLQADEFAGIARDQSRLSSLRTPPNWASESDWHFLVRSNSFFSVEGLCMDLPPRSLPKGAADPHEWWGPRVLRTREDGYLSVYSPEAPYLTQNARLLDDFVREYLLPWAQTFLGNGLLGRSPKGIAPPQKRDIDKAARLAPCDAVD
jgi:hypothetical protein